MCVVNQLDLRRARAAAVRTAAPGTLPPVVGETQHAATTASTASASRTWFRASVPGAEPPLSYERIAGGRSNLTYRVSDGDGGRWILRRPPLGTTLGSAHDMGREHRILTGLEGTDVPAPRPVALCDDESVTGAVVLRHGARRRARAARRGRGRGGVRRGRPPAARRGARGHARRPARRRPRRRRARRARPPRRLRRAPAQALEAPVGGLQDARARRDGGDPPAAVRARARRRTRPRSCTATTGSTT